MRIKVVDLLRDARARLSDPKKWTAGEYARDSAGRDTDPSSTDAVSWCGQGAIYASGSAQGMLSLEQIILLESHTDCDWAEPIFEKMNHIAIRFGFEGYMDANDQGGREVVLHVLDCAIAEFEARDPSGRPPHQRHKRSTWRPTAVQ
jgi:hypothetical protein